MADRAWLLAGLGNPGPEHAATRHNAGFVAADIIASRLGSSFKRASKHRALVAETRDGDERIVLAKPQTYMNDSGQSLASLTKYFDVPVERVVVIYDDIDLAFAVLRVRQGGGTAGHNGLKSIVAAVGPEFVRVRIGVGRPPGRMDPADYVLSPFTKKEREEIDTTIERAADAALVVVHDGVSAAQNLYN
jgi:peptidyl-tRNA hydrolase, PTH1 family